MDCEMLPEQRMTDLLLQVPLGLGVALGHAFLVFGIEGGAIKIEKADRGDHVGP